jgi:UDP-N-acetylmuramate dehydrogenase
MNIRENVSLAAYNTFGIAAQALYFIEIDSISELKTAIMFARTQNLPIHILGGGSNVLLTKNAYAAVFIKNNIKGIERHGTEIEIGSGELWHPFVLWALENNLSGIENLSLIPGTVGAAPIQNIGAYGVELTRPMRFWLPNVGV